MQTLAGTLEPDKKALRGVIEQFLYREARYMDEFLHHEWLDLWDADGDILYWVPCGDDNIDPRRHVSLIYDDRARLRERIFRLDSPAAHSQDPRSKMRRLISNVELGQIDRGLYTVHSNFLLGVFRGDEQSVYCGHVVHKLRPNDAGDFRIVSKKVMLINNGGVIGNLTFFL